jgi:dTDP-4-dehydrorhamnose reductase
MEQSMTDQPVPPGRMRILVTGGTGMLGHKMFQVLRARFPDTTATIQGSLADPAIRRVDLFQEGQVLDRLDAADFCRLGKRLQEIKPDVIINCAGVIKQRAEAVDPATSIAINTLLPHRLAGMCAAWGGRLIHFSTDCVFSGCRGSYREEDCSDAKDLYGRTKYLGEVAAPNALTLRTSIIGRELFHFTGLLEWFLAQSHRKAPGYIRAFYSGVTTNHLAEVVMDLIEHHPSLSGIYQVASRTISKYDLLSLLREAFRLDIEVVPEGQLFCDRSLVGEKFEHATGYRCPPWLALVQQLAQDSTPYEQWRA